MDCLARRALPKEHLDEETINKCMSGARKEYSKHWSDNTKPYAGIGKLLSELDKLGIAKAVLSNKPDEFTRLTVEKLLPKWSFDIVRGLGPEVPKKPDPGGALQIAQELHIQPREFIYLGDTNTDMQTAGSAGMFAVGVLWGFRDAEELQANGAKVLVKKPLDVLDLLEK